MHKTKDILDALRDRFGSDRKAAEALGITQQSFSEWRTGKSFPSDEMATKIASALGWNDGYVVAIVHAETAQNPQLRELWRNMAKQFRNAAMLALFAAAPFMAPSPANATSHNVFNASSEYALRNKRRRPLWLTGLL